MTKKRKITGLNGKTAKMSSKTAQRKMEKSGKITVFALEVK